MSQDKKNKFDQLLGTIIKTNFKSSPKFDNIFSFISGKYVKVKKEDYQGILKSILIQFER